MLTLHLLHLMSLPLALAQSCFHPSVANAPTICTLEERADCSSDVTSNHHEWPVDATRSLSATLDDVDTGVYTLTWKLNNVAGTGFLDDVRGIQVKVLNLGGVGVPYTLSCDRLKFNVSTQALVGEDFNQRKIEQRNLLNSTFLYTVNCSDGRYAGKTLIAQLRLLPLQRYAKDKFTSIQIYCQTPTTRSPALVDRRRLFNNFFTGNATEEPLSFQGAGSLILKFYNRFDYYPDLGIESVQFYLLYDSRGAKNFYNEDVALCEVTKNEIQTDVSNPCEQYRYLTPGNYKLQVRMFDSNSDVVAIGGYTVALIPTHITADKYDNHVSADNLTIEQIKDGFLFTFPVAPLHLDLSNSYDIRKSSKITPGVISYRNVTRGNATREWQNYTYHIIHQPRVVEEEIQITLTVGVKDNQNNTLEKIFTLQPPTTTQPTQPPTTTQPITRQTAVNQSRVEVIVGLTVGVILVVVIIVVIIRWKHERLCRRGADYEKNIYGSVSSNRSVLSHNILLWNCSGQYPEHMIKLQKILQGLSCDVKLRDTENIGGIEKNCQWVILDFEKALPEQLQQFSDINEGNAHKIRFGLDFNMPYSLTEDSPTEDPPGILLPKDLSKLLENIGLPQDDVTQLQDELRVTMEQTNRSSLSGESPESIRSKEYSRTQTGPTLGTSGHAIPVSPGADSATELISMTDPNDDSSNQPNLRSWDEQATALYVLNGNKYSSVGDNVSVYSYSTEKPEGTELPQYLNSESVQSAGDSVQWSRDNERPPLSGQSDHNIVSPNNLVGPYKPTTGQPVMAPINSKHVALEMDEQDDSTANVNIQEHPTDAFTC